MNSSLSGSLSVIRALRDKGHEALLAGGSVRDKLMGREPKDYDIATSAKPAQVQEIFEKTEVVGAAFGVVLVIQQGAAYEVATFRKDGAYLDGRHPESVIFSSAEEDAQRRDFTVNGMFLDLESGTIKDFVGGRADIEKKVIRAIGDPAKRFAEDRLRVLRAIRFAVQLGFEIEAETWAQVKVFASSLSPVAMERSAAELTKILTSPQRRRGIELLDESGLLAEFLPELFKLKGCTQPPEFHPEGDAWAHTLLVLDALKEPSPALAWAALLHDIAKPATWTQSPGDRIRFHGHEGLGASMAGAICKRLKMPGALQDAVVTLVSDHLRLNPIKDMKLSTLKRLLRREDFKDLLELHRADCVGSHGNLELYELALAKARDFEAVEAAAGLKPAALLSGADLIALGYAPGPQFKEMLTWLEDEQLEGRLGAKEEALKALKTRFAMDRNSSA